jgi:hypothetical protein
VELPRCASCRVKVKPGQDVVFRHDGRVEHAACPEVVCPACSRPVKPDDPIRRDGEALVHGNCWMARERATKPPAKIGIPEVAVPEPNGITSAVRAKLMAGALPRLDVQKVWAGLGKDAPCSGCDQRITRSEVEHEVYIGDGSSLRFHRTCLSVWQREVARDGDENRRQIAGGSAPSPWTLFFDLHIARDAHRSRAAYEELRAATAEGWLIASETMTRSRRIRQACSRARCGVS